MRETRVYRSFEEFEREELQRSESIWEHIDDAGDDMMALDFEGGGSFAGGKKGSRRRNEDDED